MKSFTRELIWAHVIFFIVAIVIVLVAAGCVHAETGIASHYGVGDGLNGSRTASGERFNAYGLTAAHRTRKLGSYVIVTNARNGRSVRVRINDRGPSVQTRRVIDLSYGAAREIGISGIARVRIE